MTRGTKFVASAALAVAVAFSASAPAVEAAQLTASQIQAVVSLLQAFGADASSIANVEQALGGVETSASTTAVSSGLIGFFRIGSEGDGVTLLQILLAADPSIYPEGVVSGYFGALTQKALRQYQKKHGFEQVGFVGPRTLRQLQEDLEDNPVGTEDDDDADEDGDEDGDDSQNRGRGHRFCAIVPPGHLIAPGWLRKHGGVVPVIPTCQTLPGGIAKKLGQGSGTGTTTPDTTAPTISNIDVESITATSAKVEWDTNEKATSVVAFGTTASYGSTVSAGATRSTSHSLSLTGLTAATAYHYRITSVDGAGNAATSSDETFTTLSTSDTTAPVIDVIEVNSITSTSAEVKWDTNEDATSKVYYSASTPLVIGTASTVSDSTLENSHDLDLSSLTASTTYYYLVVSADAAGNTATSSQNSFATLP